MLTGGCLCGAVRFELRAPFFDAAYCHCTRCQGRTGTGSSVNGLIEARHVAVLAGAEAIRAWQPQGGCATSQWSSCRTRRRSRSSRSPSSSSASP